MTTIQKLFTLLLSPIWPVVTLIKTQWKQFKYEAIPEDPREEKEEIEKLTQISNRAHLIEVSMESSLQPLIQLHVILNLIVRQKNHRWRGFRLGGSYDIILEKRSALNF